MVLKVDMIMLGNQAASQLVGQLICQSTVYLIWFLKISVKIFKNSTTNVLRGRPMCKLQQQG